MKGMYLKYFQLVGSKDGWVSPKIEFSRSVTAIEGPNGAGKTPLMNSIAFALGFDKTLPLEVVENCHYAVLELTINQRALTFKRNIKDKDLNLEIYERDVKIKEFKGYGVKGEYSRFFLELTGIRDIPLTSLGSQTTRHATPIYISTLIPFFYISQSKGWVTHYSPLDKEEFILNQYEEIVRALFDLPALSPYSVKEEQDVFYQKRDSIRSSISELEKKVDFYKQQLAKFMNLSKAEIELYRDQFGQRVEDLKIELMAFQTDGSNEINTQVNHLQQEMSTVSDQIFQLRFKLRGLNSLEEDINRKVQVEEDSFDAQSVFQKYCGYKECPMFTIKNVPFGKKILYLNDQLKDIRKTSLLYEENLSSLEKNKTRIQSEINTLVSSPANNSQADLGQKLELLKENIKNFSDYSEAFKNREEFEKFSASLSEEQKNLVDVTETIQLFKGKRSKISERHIEIRNTFEALLKEWLDSLSTPNIRKYKISIDNNFNLFFRDAKFEPDSEQDGSTRTRIILAYHATLLETSLKYNGNHPPFLMIDTPKKDEIEVGDLESFFTKLRGLKDIYKKDIQIILAYKDPFFDLDSKLDIRFEPTFEILEDGKLKKKYLGPSNK